MGILKNVMLVLLGIVLAVVLFCAVVGIASAVNDISFGQQIVNWFGSSTPALEEVVENIVEKSVA